VPTAAFVVVVVVGAVAGWPVLWSGPVVAARSDVAAEEAARSSGCRDDDGGLAVEMGV
jgi:hypothetical protein